MVKRLSATDQNSQNLANIPTPVNTGDAANKSYVDSGLGAKITQVVHGSNASTTRPSATYVEWVGSVQPTNAISGDTWIDTSA